MAEPNVEQTSRTSKLNEPSAASERERTGMDLNKHPETLNDQEVASLLSKIGCSLEERIHTTLSLEEIKLLLKLDDRGILLPCDENYRLDLRNFDLSNIDWRTLKADILKFNLDYANISNAVVDEESLIYILKSIASTANLAQIQMSGLDCSGITSYVRSIGATVVERPVFNNLDMHEMNATGASIYSKISNCDISKGNFEGCYFDPEVSFPGTLVAQTNFEGSNVTPKQLVDAEGVEEIIISNKEEFLNEVKKRREGKEKTKKAAQSNNSSPITTLLGSTLSSFFSRSTTNLEAPPKQQPPTTGLKIGQEEQVAPPSKPMVTGPTYKARTNASRRGTDKSLQRS